MTVEVPLLDLRPQYAAIRTEVDEAMARVVASQHFILGEEVALLEQEVASYSEAAFGVGCGSGSDALLLALMALGVGPGDEVVCPTYTFFATAGSIARLGATPVFADIDARSYNVCPESLRDVARGCRRLKAIVPVHLFGQAADQEAVFGIARELGVPVIEDAAQAIGARDATGARVGARDSLTCLSFFPSKNLGAFGDAGMVLTQDEALAERMRVLRVHGMEPKYFHPHVGVNSRLDALQAAVLRVKLRHLEEWTKARQQNAAFYDRAFAQRAPGAVSTPAPPEPPATHIYNQYVIRVAADRRDPLRAHLGSNGIGCEVYYPLPLHRQECFADAGPFEAMPRAEAAARETLALPIYPELTERQQNAVIDTVASFFD